MDSSIAALFDDDDDILVEDVPRRHKTPHSDDDDDGPSPRPTKRRRQAPAGDSDDDSMQVMAPRDVNMSALEQFVLEDDEDVGTGWKGKEAMEREIIARAQASRPPPVTPHAILSSSPPPEGPDDAAGKTKGKGGKAAGDKPRRKPMVLNEARLCGEQGFPALIKDMKDFKPRGKGHEVSDLNRLMQHYQFWTHRLYPKAPFRETVARVEKLCRTRRLENSLKQWKDESQGIAPPLEDPESDDSDSGVEVVDATNRAQSRLPPSEADAMSDAPGPSSSRAASPAPSIPPPASRSEYDDADLYDEDLDALLQEQERFENGQASSAPPPPLVPSASASTAQSGMDWDDDSLWDNFDDPEMAFNAPPAKALPPPTKVVHDDDFDMDEDAWEAMNEMEALTAAKPPPPPQPNVSLPATKTVPPPSSAPAPPRPSAVEDDLMDDMYV